MSSIKIYLKRLVEMSELSEMQEWQWEGCEPPISLQEVQDALNSDQKEEREPYGDTFNHLPETRPRSYHVGRILYFVRHPEEIREITVDNQYYETWILPFCEVIDGWHRLAAALILNLEKVDINYGGRGDIEDYLTGVSDEMPLEDLCLG